MRLVYGISILLLIFSFSGCSDKPSEDDVLKSCNDIFTPIDNLYEKYDKDFRITDYIECEDVDIIDSYEKNGIYIMKVVPHFEIKEDFSPQILKD